MDFGELFTDPSKRKRLLSAFLAVLLLAVVCAAVGVVSEIPALTIFSIVLVAGALGVIGKFLVTLAVHLAGTSSRLIKLNDRYDDTEKWLEQFDRGTRATFTSLGKAQAELRRSLEEASSDIGQVKEELGSEIQTVARESATRESLDAFVKSSEAEVGDLEKSFGVVRESNGKLSKRIDEVGGRAKDIERSLDHIREEAERVQAAIDAAKEEYETRLSQAKNALGKDIKEQDRLRRLAVHATKVELETKIDEVDAASKSEAAKLSKKMDSTSSLASRLRGDGYVQFNRLLGGKFASDVTGEVGNRLGLSIEHSELRYLERKVQQVEAICEGRLATTAEDAVARVFAARSCEGDSLRILEIGVLFGLGSGFMHTALAPFYDSVKLHLLDPFDGYYGSDHLDPLTGQKVTRAAVERNLRRLAIDWNDFEIIEGFSTDDGVQKKAKQGAPYDVVVIDGDHTYDGVREDFERYAEYVKPSGMLIVDDYGSEDWPEVTKYVDETIASDGRFEQVAVLSRTAIFRRKAVGTGKAATAAGGKASPEPTPAKAKTPSKKATKKAKAAKKPSAKKKAAKKSTAYTSSKKATPSRKKATSKRVKPLAEEIAGVGEDSEVAAERGG
ncbi:MAG: hypothetical protein ED559_07950 [Phycisphaera sp.]|nr:MAG: hypothetical protein ED559_07950 [Phycisphaera sp.]